MTLDPAGDALDREMKEFMLEVIRAEREIRGKLDHARIADRGVVRDLLVSFLMSSSARRITGRLLSARFDQKRLRDEARAIEQHPHLFRLRRIDEDLFAAHHRGKS